MNRKYLAQVIATDIDGLQMISACCAGAKIKVSNVKYLSSNKVFLFDERYLTLETLILAPAQHAEIKV